MPDFTEDQKAALKELYVWFFEKRSAYITLGGYAGTGKTTVVSYLRKILDSKNNKLKVAFCSYTGKSVQVLSTSLKKLNAIFELDTVKTIHSLIYNPIISNDNQIIGWGKVNKLEFDLIVLDEASMVDRSIWSDLLSFNIPIIAVGDHGQLPPINGDFNLMKDPQIKLVNIHRQAKENEIIKVATLARTKGKIPAGNYNDQVIKYTSEDLAQSDLMTEILSEYDKDTLILCGFNNTRVQINNFIRNTLGFFTEEPQIDDRVICLRNNHKKGIYNGMTGTIIDIRSQSKDTYQCSIKLDSTNNIYSGEIYKKQFNSTTPLNFTEIRKNLGDTDLFDFGYCLTVHKAQGSESSKVVLLEQKSSHMNEEAYKKWLYTGVTRAIDKLIIFG